MQLYEVGGAVRDALLGRPPGDRDWVVVGATPEALLAQGYRPVGRDFPVFLHPQTGEEVALARSERKSAPGYHGFVFHTAPDVTLAQDLARRDLTINAMARDERGRLIDPCGGQQDLHDKVLRHVSPAFAEDPVRLLRVARFAARLPDFSIAPETMALLQQMVRQGEVDALVPERVWQELARGLMEERPSRMWQVLDTSGALPRLLPELPATPARLQRVDRAAAVAAPLPVRYAVALHEVQAPPCTPEAAAVEGVGLRWRVPNECQALALLLLRMRDRLQQEAPGPTELLQGLDAADAWRRPQRFEALLQAAGLLDLDARPLRRWNEALQAATHIDAAAVSAAALAAGARGPAIGQAIQAARQAAIERRAPEWG